MQKGAKKKIKSVKSGELADNVSRETRVII